MWSYLFIEVILRGQVIRSEGDSSQPGSAEFSHLHCHPDRHSEEEMHDMYMHLDAGWTAPVRRTCL